MMSARRTPQNAMEYHRKSPSKNSNQIYVQQKCYDHIMSDRSTYIEEDTEPLCLYQCDKKRKIEDENYEQGSYYVSQDLYHQERRAVLCNYILDEQCPTCQLPSYNYYDEDYGERKPAKSRYMDFYLKYQEEQSKHEASENPTDIEPTLLEASCKTLTTEPPDPRHTKAKSRYMDYQDNLEQNHGVQKRVRKTSQLDWKDYHRLDTIHKFLDDLQYNYPSLCTTGVIGSSLEKRDIKVLKVSNSNFDNLSIWIDGGIHAREWIAPAVNTYIANYVVRNFDKLPRSMHNKDWYFLPVVNPDGYEYSHTNYRMWRKNKAWYGNECVGVDLNRNFSCGWGGKGSSEEPKSPFYRGPRPFSEPESRAIRDMILYSGVEFKVYITLHSFGQVILFPFAYRTELCPDYIRLLEGATTMAKAIYKTSGNIYKVGISRDVMYGAAGTSCDWSYGEAKIPFSYLLELNSRKHRFRLPEIEIEETAKEILSAVMALMEFVDNYYADDATACITDSSNENEKCAEGTMTSVL